MSIASEITRLQTAKADLKTAIEGKGVTVPSDTLLDDYADLVDDIPSGGGGGITTIASGTFTPSANGLSQSIPIGKKMAQTDFFIIVYADDETTVPYDTTYKGLIGTLLCDKTYGSYDLQSDVSGKWVTGKHIYKIDNSGSITNKTANGIYGGSYSLRNTSEGSYYPSVAHNTITRNSSGFTITLRWTSQNFVGGVRYNYKIMYYGSDPTNDIVEVA